MIREVTSAAKFIVKLKREYLAARKRLAVWHGLMPSLRRNVALVTGGAGGIARASARCSPNKAQRRSWVITEAAATRVRCPTSCRTRRFGTRRPPCR